jgi:hypothetical protein
VRPNPSLESGLSTAGRLARAAGRGHHPLRGQADLPRPAAQLELQGLPHLSSNSQPCRIAKQFSTEPWAVDPRSGVGTAEAASRKRTGRTTNGHRCSFSAADPDARRARGPHSLVEDDGGRLHELNRHTPYRSNLDASTLAVTRRWKKVLWAPLVGTARWMVRRAQAGRTKSSPRRSTAQAMRAFFAAMATTARQ